MSNLPSWAQNLATTPRLTRYAKTMPDGNLLYVQAETGTLFVGKVSKVGKRSFQWEAWSRERKPDDRRSFKVIGTGRSRTLLAAIAKVHFGYAQHFAKKDAEKDRAA